MRFDQQALELVSSGEKVAERVENPGIIMIEKQLSNPSVIKQLQEQGYGKGTASIKMTPAGVHEGNAWIGLEHDAIKDPYRLGAEPVKKGGKELLRDFPGLLSSKTGFLSKEKVKIGNQEGHFFIPKGQKAMDLFGFSDSPEWAEDLRNAESAAYRHGKSEYAQTQRFLEAFHPPAGRITRKLRDMPTTGLVNHVLEPNGRGHHIAQNKAY